MEVVWKKYPLTAGEVIEQLADQKDWKQNTIRTLLARLVKKKALHYEAEGNRYSYRPKVMRRQCVQTESHSFLNRIFGGSAKPLLVHFVNEAKLSKEDIKELKEILNKKGK